MTERQKDRNSDRQKDRMIKKTKKAKRQKDSLRSVLSVQMELTGRPSVNACLNIKFIIIFLNTPI